MDGAVTRETRRCPSCRTKIVQEFCARHTDDELRSALAGEPVLAVARDRPAGAPPHGLDG